MKNKIVLLILIFGISIGNIYSQTSKMETIHCEIEEPKVDSIIKILPIKRDNFCLETAFFFKQKKIEYLFNKYANVIYHYEFIIDTIGVFSDIKYMGNDNSPMSQYKREIMESFWNSIIKKTKWDFSKLKNVFAVYKRTKTKAYFRVIQFTDDRFLIEMGNDAFSKDLVVGYKLFGEEI
ncbi:MAG: hypothetical protein U5N85_05405 [Arcicella sp.]|nr:hypothetical protein [Arcicella sp.]